MLEDGEDAHIFRWDSLLLVLAFEVGGSQVARNSPFARTNTGPVLIPHLGTSPEQLQSMTSFDVFDFPESFLRGLPVSPLTFVAPLSSLLLCLIFLFDRYLCVGLPMAATDSRRKQKAR